MGEGGTSFIYLGYLLSLHVSIVVCYLGVKNVNRTIRACRSYLMGRLVSDVAIYHTKQNGCLCIILYYLVGTIVSVQLLFVVTVRSPARFGSFLKQCYFSTAC